MAESRQSRSIKRKFNHEYTAHSIYHILLYKKEGCPSFDIITGDVRIPPKEEGHAKTSYSPLGAMIRREIYSIQFQYNFIEIYQFMVMPDPINILLKIKERTPEKLEYNMEQFKERIAKKWSRGKIYCEERGRPFCLPLSYG